MYCRFCQTETVFGDHNESIVMLDKRKRDEICIFCGKKQAGPDYILACDGCINRSMPYQNYPCQDASMDLMRFIMGK